jgi:hypothetical protein
MRWVVSAVFFLIAAMTVWRSEFKFPKPIPPITRATFPEGFWAIVAMLVLIAGWLIISN